MLFTASNPKVNIRKGQFTESSHKNSRKNYDWLGLSYMATAEQIRVQAKGMGHFGQPELGNRGGGTM